jgi:hypothetical protein
VLLLLFVVVLLLVLRECSSLTPISWLLGKKIVYAECSLKRKLDEIDARLLA